MEAIDINTEKMNSGLLTWEEVPFGGGDNLHPDDNLYRATYKDLTFEIFEDSVEDLYSLGYNLDLKFADGSWTELNGYNDLPTMEEAMKYAELVLNTFKERFYDSNGAV